jgi:hypothetical protein
MRKHVLWLVGLGFIACIPGCEDYPDDIRTTGSLSVRVTDGSWPVAGVDIAIAETDIVSTTDSNGKAFFTLPPGDYFVDAFVCCSGPGYIEYHVPVVVEAGEVVAIELGACLACVCASPETPIATPQGSIAIAALMVGDLVYSIHEGQVVVVPIERTNRVAVRGHRVVRVLLATGATLEMSPGHPTADGRTFGELRAGDQLGGVSIIAARLVAYSHDHTYDILPTSDSGVYFAGGVAVGSTLHSSWIPGLRRGHLDASTPARLDRMVGSRAPLE